MELEPVALEAFNARMFIWTTLAAALYITGIVLLGIGIQQLVTESILSAALNIFQSGSVASTVQGVLAGLLVLIGVADICVVSLQELNADAKWTGRCCQTDKLCGLYDQH